MENCGKMIDLKSKKVTQSALVNTVTRAGDRKHDYFSGWPRMVNRPWRDPLSESCYSFEAQSLKRVLKVTKLIYQST